MLLGLSKDVNFCLRLLLFNFLNLIELGKQMALVHVFQ